MDLIYTDKNGAELGYLINASLDLDVGNTEDFEIVLGIKNNILDYNYMFFAEDTEYGGIIKNRKVDTSTNKIYYSGYTWRGMLSKKIVAPLSGDDYYIVSGNFSSICSSLLSYCGLTELFKYDTEATDVAIGTYQFKRYDNLLNGFKEMLKTVSKKLKIRYKDGSIMLSAASIVNYTDELEFSSDGNVTFKIEDNRNYINHLICLGKGDLSARQVVHLYLQSDGTIGNTKYYSGISELTEIYDYANAESFEELESSGKEKFIDNIVGKKVEMTVADIDVDLEDIISAREYITDTLVQKKVTNKIVQISTTGKMKISYKVGD